MNIKLYSVKIPIREPSSSDLDLDVCCQGHDSDWPPTDFSCRLLLFVKKLLTVNVSTYFSVLHEESDNFR